MFFSDKLLIFFVGKLLTTNNGNNEHTNICSYYEHMFEGHLRSLILTWHQELCKDMQGSLHTRRKLNPSPTVRPSDRPSDRPTVRPTMAKHG